MPTQHECAKNAFVVTLRRARRGNACRAQAGKKKVLSKENMQARSPHFIVFVSTANKESSVADATSEESKTDFQPRCGNEHEKEVEYV